MSDKPNPMKYILHKDESDAQAFRFRHPLGGEKSECTMSTLGRSTGLKRVGVNIARVPAGKEAFVYHRHHGEEEWVYILEGKARSEIDDVAETVRAGDFIGYPAGVAHQLVNIGSGDLVCLMGGESLAVEIADFPRHGKRVLRTASEFAFMNAAAATPFVPKIEPLNE